MRKFFAMLLVALFVEGCQIYIGPPEGAPPMKAGFDVEATVTSMPYTPIYEGPQTMFCPGNPYGPECVSPTQPGGATFSDGHIHRGKGGIHLPGGAIHTDPGAIKPGDGIKLPPGGSIRFP